jgi:hypothetical protein
VARTIFAVATAVGCAALPSAAQAATTPRAVVIGASHICLRVSPAAVSAIVGYTVPAPTSDTGSSVIDQALNLSETYASCIFEVAGTAATPFASKSVDLDSYVFSKSVTVATLKAVAAADQEKALRKSKVNNFKVTYSNYPGLGVTAIYYTLTASFGLPKGVTLPKGFTLPKSLGFAYSGIATLDGTKSFAASVNNDTIAQSKLAALVKLAMKL